MGNELSQTKNKFKVLGKVTRIDKDGAYKEDVKKGGKHDKKTFRSLRFGVKTSDNNEITVSMFSYEPEQVFLWNSDKAKKAKEAKKKYKGERVDFDEWLENKDKYREDGYAVLQSRIGLNFDEKGKVVSEGMPSYIAIDELYDSLDNGDSVVIEGNISYSSYENQQGKVVEQKNFNIETLKRLKNDIDFEDEKFEEVTYFEQEFVFVDAVEEKKENKVFVTGRHINYNKTFKDIEFVVDYSDGADGTDKSMVTLANAFLKKFKFGDLLSVFGDNLNRVVTLEVEDEVETEEDKLLASLGGKSKPKHAERWAQKDYINELQIHGLEAWDKAVYEEDDFKVDSLIEEEEEEKKEDFGGKQKKDTSPFDNDDDDDEFNEDDLPF